MSKDLKKKPVIAAYFKFVDIIDAIAKILGGGLLCLISITVFASVISRFIPGFSLTWVEELVTYAMAWLCTLGGGIATRHGDMTTVTIILNLFPEKVKKIVRVIACLFSLVIFALIIKAGWQMALVGNLRKSTAVPAITMFWMYLALPVGMIIMFLNTVARIIEILDEKGGV